MPENMELEDLIIGALESHARELRVALPGRIQSYDASKQRASVELALTVMMPTTDDDETPVRHPVISNVPICFPQGGGGFFVSFPMAKGDPVMVVFADVPIGMWLNKGDVCDPGSSDMHGLHGAVAFPCGPQPTRSVLQGADGSNMILGKDGATSAQIEITPSEIHLGKGASKQAARNGDTVDIGTFTFTPSSGTGVSVAGTLVWTPPGGGTAVPVTSAGADLTGKISQGSSKVKIED